MSNLTRLRQQGSVASREEPHAKSLVDTTIETGKFNTIFDHEPLQPLIYQHWIRLDAKVDEIQVPPNNAAAEQEMNKQFRLGLQLDGFPVIGRFVDRPEQMKQLRESLLPRSKDDRRKVLVVHGLGGVGKTQFSAEFARQHQSEYTSGFWVDGSTEESLQHGIAALSKIIPGGFISEETQSPAEKPKEPELVRSKVLEWFSAKGNHTWLLIIDDLKLYDHTTEGDAEVYDLESYLPKADHGHILITTRQPEIGRYGFALNLDVMDLDQARGLFAENAGLSYASQQEGVANSLISGYTEQNDKLLDLLGGHPIAIAQAGTFIKEANSTISSYVEQYEDNLRALKDPETNLVMPMDTTLQKSVLVTTAISYSHIKREAEIAANFLNLWTYLDNRDLWFQLFTPDFPLPVQADSLWWFRSAIEAEQEFVTAMRTLQAYSMIQAKENCPAYCIHPLIHQCLKQSIVKERVPELAWLAVRTVGRAISSDSSLKDELSESRLRSHADCCYQLITEKVPDPYFTLTNPLLQQSVKYDVCLIYLSALYRLGKHFRDRKRMREACNLIQRVCEGYSDILGADNVDTCKAFSELAAILAYEGKIEEAEVAYLQALEGYERTLGSDNSLTLSTAHTLSRLFHEQGKLDRAGQMLRLILKGLESTRGAEDPATIHTVIQLGVLCSIEGKLNEAEELYLRALPVQKRTPDIEYLLLIKSINNLALEYLQIKKFVEAEKMSLIALDESAAILPALAKESLGILAAVATAYQERGRLEEAERIFMRVLQGYEDSPDEQQKEISDTAYNLSTLYLFQGKLQGAEKMLLKSIEGYEKTLGPDHSYTLDAVGNLAAVLQQQDRISDAEVLYLQSLERKERALGSGHRSTLGSKNNLGQFYAAQNKLDEAENMYLQAIEGYQNLESPHNLTALSVLNNLGSLYMDRGSREKAENIYLKALDGYEAALPSNYTPAHATVEKPNDLNHSSLMGSEKRIAYVQQPRDGDHESSGVRPGHTWSLNTLAKLAILHLERGEFLEAEYLYWRILEGTERILGREDPSTIKHVQDLVFIVYHRCRRESTGKQVGSNKGIDVAPRDVGFLTDSNPVFRLTWFAKTYGQVFPEIFDFLGKALLQNADHKNARIAFKYQVLLSMDASGQSGIACDHCENHIRPATGRFICWTCAQVDLCTRCFNSWSDGEWELISCQEHDFYQVYKPMDSSLDEQEDDIGLWMQSVMAMYGQGSTLS